MAMQETNGKDPFEILSWRGKDEILFLPYYDREDVANKDFLSGYQNPAAKYSLADSRSWVNLPHVGVTDERSANKNSLNHLSSGADGVFFELCNHSDINFNELLRDIEWPYCFLGFLSKNHSSLLDQLASLIENKFDPTSVRGGLFWESIPKEAKLDFYFTHCPSFKSLGLIIEPASPAEEISNALFEGARVVEAFSGAYPPATVIRSICFSLPAEASLIESIAKFKALRMLWYQIARAYGNIEYNTGDLHIHGFSRHVPDGAYGPHENMLKGTFAAMAALLGGCDSLTVASGEHPVASRWARNVSILLQEESFFQRVADPVAGAFSLDSITDELAAKAWSLFQVKWQRR